MIADFDRYYEQCFAVFEKLWPRIARFMGCYGREGTVGSGNYGVLDDFILMAISKCGSHLSA
ncbi:hypothetical protein [Afipia sp. P52-10]|uniref:hypothetical protein n=1 Tax=Afipia sp. P52-10 TaxID=1429916 RepID=UPI0012692FB2|nr:hypothetical protein [Afipia sp. P52-10]